MKQQVREKRLEFHQERTSDGSATFSSLQFSQLSEPA